MTESISDETPFVSVVIPCWNASSFIARALESVRAQVWSGRYEVVLVDDGSQDREALWNVALQYLDLPLRCFFHLRNLNGSAARNSGVEAADGDLIAFLDADDYWLPDHLREVAAPHSGDSGRTEGGLVVSSALWREDESGDREFFPKSMLKKGESVGDYIIARSGLLQTSTLCLPRELALRVRFNENLPRHQDLDFVLGLQESGAAFLQLAAPSVVWIWSRESGASAASLKKGESTDFCIGWVHSNAHRLSRQAMHNYYVFYLARRAFAEQRYALSLRYVMAHLPFVGGRKLVQVALRGLETFVRHFRHRRVDVRHDALGKSNP